LTEKSESNQKEKILNPEEEEIIASVEKLLIAGGNHNYEVLDDMTSDNALIALSYQDNRIWKNAEIHESNRAEP